MSQPSLQLAPPGTAIQVSSPRLVTGDRIDRLGVIYEFVGKAEGKKKFRRLDTLAEVWIDNADLLEQMVSREIRLAVPSWLSESRAKVQALDFHSLPEHEKRRVQMRQAYVDAFLRNRERGYPRKVADVRDAVHRERMANPINVAAGEGAPSLAAIYGWVAIVERPGGPAGIKRLRFAESQRGLRGPQIADDVVPILMEAVRSLWYTPQRLRVRVIFDRVVADAAKAGLPAERVPCLRTIRRMLKSLPPYAVMRARHGTRAADDKYRSKGAMAEAVLPGQVYEVDAHKMDFVGVDTLMGLPLGRMWVTVVIDRCTRMIVGFHLHVEPPSSLTIAAALRNAFAPKLYMLKRWPGIGRPWVAWGLPELVVLDNGLENHAVFLTEAFDELGVAWVFAPRRTPEFKPHIERFFGTLTGDFSARLPGWTGSNPKEKGDYDAMGMACLTLHQADELLHRWVTNYNLDWHAGIRDIPERRWLELTAQLEVTPIEDMGMLDVLLGGYAMRTPSAKGIHLFGLRFGDTLRNRPMELIRTRAGAADLAKVRIRFDRNDLSHIHVQDPLTKEYLRIDSLDPDYTTGLTLAQHRIIRRHAVERCRGYVSVGELCTARDDLQRRLDEMTGHEPMSERRFAAVFNGLGSKGSWADFHRLAEAEYGGGHRESRWLSVVDLMASEDFAGEGDPVGIQEPGPVDTPQSTVPDAAGVAKAAEDVATRADALGVTFDGVDLAADGRSAERGPMRETADKPDSEAEFRERMAALGMET